MTLKERAISAQHKWIVLGRFWHAWNQEVAASRSRDESHFAFAREHFAATLKVKILAAWQDGAQALKAERRADLRRRQLRSKVDLWLEEDREKRGTSSLLGTIPPGSTVVVDGVAVNPRVWQRERNPYKY